MTALTEELLNETYQERVIDITEQAKAQAPERGFVIEKIYYNGFWSQGDGASWIGEVNVSDYIEYKIRNGGIDGIPHGVLETMYWLFEGGVFDRKLNVRHEGYYYHDGGMRLADFYWTFMGNNDTETMGNWGGPFADTPIKYLLQATNWSWENGSDLPDYYTALHSQIIDDARAYARDIYRKLEEAYTAVHDGAVA